MPVCNRIGGEHEFGSTNCFACSVHPTAACFERQRAENPRMSRGEVVRQIVRLHRGGLICLDCGSENHTRGHALCNYEAPT